MTTLQAHQILAAVLPPDSTFAVEETVWGHLKTITHTAYAVSVLPSANGEECARYSASTMAEAVALAMRGELKP